MAYHVIYRSPERTLEAKEVEDVHKEVVAMLQKEFGADMRT
jgi:phenylalanyl-tRNA synthetase beta subunit